MGYHTKELTEYMIKLTGSYETAYRELEKYGIHVPDDCSNGNQA